MWRLVFFLLLGFLSAVLQRGDLTISKTNLAHRSNFCPQPLQKTVTTLMAGILRSIVQRPPSRLQIVTKGVESLICTDWIRQKFTKSRIPAKVFQPLPGDHEKYGGDPEHPHKLHIVTRIKSTKRRPYWEKDVIKMLGLEKAHTPQVHKNIPSVNAKLKVVKHLIRIKPLRLPQGLPAEEDMAHTCLKSTGELVVRWRLSPADHSTAGLSARAASD